MAEWSFAVGPWRAGLLQGQLRGAKSRKVTFRLSSAGNSEASCEINGRSHEASLVQELVTDLHAFRRERPGLRRDRLYRGRIGKTNDKLTRVSHRVTVPSLDYRAVLDRRNLMSGSKVSWAATDDLGTVALGLLEQAQNKTGGSYGITPGVASVLGVVAGSREFKLGDSISAKIQELAESPVGFDWDITPALDPASAAMQLDMWSPQRGLDRGVVVEYGKAVAEFDRTVDSSTYANADRLSGTAPDGSQTPPAIQERVVPDIASRPEGRWDKAYGTPVTTGDALVARADWQIADSQVIQPSYVLTMQEGWWEGPGHVWLGDPVTFRAKSGPRIQIDTRLRVEELAVDIGDDGGENVQLTIGAPRPDYRKRSADVEQRLSTLERR